MQWETLISPVRLWLEDENELDSCKNQFSRDYDRVLFSGAFRRLGKKTQVHPLASNDHIHNRLTHSLEVASVGRSLGLSVGDKIKEELPATFTPFDLGQIVQAACLAHDIGNPPFGHAGEEAIRSWFTTKPELLSDFSDDQKDDFLNFEGNAQSFRIVTKLENNSNEGGMRLSYSTLATLLKYPWTTKEIKKIKKYSCFQSEKDLLSKVSDRVGLIKQDEFHYCRHPLAFLAEAADDICYRILDIEDAHELSILTFEEVKEILSPLCQDDKDYKKIVDSDVYSPRRKISYLRGKSISKLLTQFLIHLFQIMMRLCPVTLINLQIL
jgi:dGTPase